MKKCITVLSVLIILTITTNAQIPNSGFENWTTFGSYEEPAEWYTGNSSSSGSFYPVTKSSDHYPVSVGNYSIKLENQIPLINGSSYGFATTNYASCSPSFPITGHPTSLCGYYKCFPLNNDTVQIGLMLFQNGIWVAGANLTCTNTVSDWTSFNIPISSYSSADSAYLSIAAFYNDTTCGFPYGPFGNSVLYVDNLSFNNLITSVSEGTSRNFEFNLYPNPASDFVTLNTDFTNNEDLTLNFYNVVGSLIKSEIIKHNTRQINIAELCDGIYLVLIKSKDLIGTQRLIIQR